MQGTLGVAASDVEPGLVIVTVTAEDGHTFLIPLRGDDLARFAGQFAVANMTAMLDAATAALNELEPEQP